MSTPAGVKEARARFRVISDIDPNALQNLLNQPSSHLDGYTPILFTCSPNGMLVVILEDTAHGR